MANSDLEVKEELISLTKKYLQCSFWVGYLVGLVVGVVLSFWFLT